MLKYSCFPATALEAHFLPFLKNPFHQVTLSSHLISAFYLDSLCSGHRATETVHTTATLSQSDLMLGILTSKKCTWSTSTTCALSTGVIMGLKSTLRGTSFICLSSWASAVHMSSCLAVTYETQLQVVSSYQSHWWALPYLYHQNLQWYSYLGCRYTDPVIPASWAWNLR